MKKLLALMLLFAADAALAQGTSIAGLLATGYELKAAVAIPGGEVLYFEGRPGGANGSRQIYRCVVDAPRGADEAATARCAQVR